MPYFFKHVTKPLTGQLDFDFKINTGDVEHKVLLGNLFSYLDRKLSTEMFMTEKIH